jgi:hypothetical protein
MMCRRLVDFYLPLGMLKPKDLIPKGD